MHEEKGYHDAVMMGAITREEIALCRRSVRVGNRFTVKTASNKGEQGKGDKTFRRGNVVAKYPNLVVLDCGAVRTSITYVQILQKERKGRKYIT